MRALPVDVPTVSQTPSRAARPFGEPIMDSRPVAAPTPSPLAELPPVMVNPAVLAASQLAIADGCYSRKQPDLAVPEYEKFLVMASRNAPGRERALYRLAESQRQMGSLSAAESTFLKLIADYPNGEFIPAASFRLGEMREARGEYPNAADNFAVTVKGATDPTIRIASLYHQAFCMEKSGRQQESIPLYQSAAMEKQGGSAPNPFRTPALIRLADLSLASANKEAALADYRAIMAVETKGEPFAEAAMKAAQLETELGHPEEARKLFEKVASSQDSGRWQSAASLGSLRLAAQSGDNTAILKASEGALAINSENKPEILLLQANALRKSGKNGKAIENYDTIIREYPGSKAASDAPFQRLLALHAMRSPQLLSEIDQYLLTASDPSDRARARLLKAEATLMASKYREAAQLYHELPVGDLPPSSKPDIVYKEAWAFLQAINQSSGDHPADASSPTPSKDIEEAVAALTRFIETYPEDERTPAALAERGLLNLKQKNLEAAAADFTQLQNSYPKAPQRELALQQKALLLGQQQKSSEMVETFSQLLHDYPKSAAAPQAHYWIGLTALDNKDASTAITELSEARKADPKQFGERAGLRILLARYNQNNPAEATREAMALKPSLIPPEVGRWLGLKTMESGDPEKAERFLTPLVKAGLPGETDADIQGTLAQALILQGKTKEAQIPAAACLKLAKDPASRAKALLVSAAIQRSMKNLPAASSMVEEAMLLQPEGQINAEARILSGDLLASKQDFAGAAKAYMTVAVLCDDASLTPKALARAADAYRRAANPLESQKALDELHKRFPNNSTVTTQQKDAQ
jgi:TolA-binding protein